MNFWTPFETLPKSLYSLKLTKPSPKSKKINLQPLINCQVSLYQNQIVRIPTSPPENTKLQTHKHPTLFHNSDSVPFLKSLVSTWPFSVTSEVITKAGAGVSHLKTLKWFYGNFFVWFRNIFFLNFDNKLSNYYLRKNSYFKEIIFWTHFVLFDFFSWLRKTLYFYYSINFRWHYFKPNII